MNDVYSILKRAHDSIKGVHGGIMVVRKARSGLTKTGIRLWIDNLRSAADELEKLL